MFTQRITAETIAVSGTGNTAETTITVPETVNFAAGVTYDVLLNTQVPSGTDGTIVTITNGTIEGSILQCGTGNYCRARNLGSRKVLRVQFFDDPEHFNLLCVRG